MAGAAWCCAGHFYCDGVLFGVFLTWFFYNLVCSFGLLVRWFAGLMLKGCVTSGRAGARVMMGESAVQLPRKSRLNGCFLDSVGLADFAFIAITSRAFFGSIGVSYS